jgi:hypothetical protein
MSPARFLAVAALLAALPAAAQLHKCKDKAGKTVYQDHACEAGTDAGTVAGAPAAGPQGAMPPSDYAALGLWETTLVFPDPGRALSPEEFEIAGMTGFLLGRPMKTVICTESPVRLLIIEHACEKQIAARGGTCRKSEPRGQGEQSVSVITGDFRSRFHVEQTITTTNQQDASQGIGQSTADYRYVGPCRPGMSRHTTLWVNGKGEWVTEAQMTEEVDGIARRAMQREKNRR